MILQDSHISCTLSVVIYQLEENVFFSILCEIRSVFLLAISKSMELRNQEFDIVELARVSCGIIVIT